MVTRVKLTHLAISGDFALMKWLYAEYRDCCRVEGALLAAVRLGQLPMVKWLHETFRNAKESAYNYIDEAAANGHLDVVKWLHVNRFDAGTFRAMNHAAKGGFLDVVQWLH